MAAIDDIWDEPLAHPSPPKRRNTVEDDDDDEDDAPYRSSKRPRSTLFFDSDSEHETGSGEKPPAEIDDLFKDLASTPVEDLQITPALDLDALRRAAEAERANDARPTPSEPPPNASSRKEGATDDEDKDKTAKKRKTIPRLDEGRLLGPNGIPALIKEAKKFKIKGKGHEATDLNRLLTLYQYWTHQLYPRNQFSDTINRVEKLCHSRRMHVALSVWQDESKGLINGQEPPEIVDVDQDSDDDRQNQNPDQGDPSEPPTRPPSSASERTPSNVGDNDDDFDIDALIREDQTMQQQAHASSTVQQPVSNIANRQLDNEFDIAMWEDFAFTDNDNPLLNQALHPPPPKLPTNDDQDEEMWDIVKELEETQTDTSAAGGKVTDPAPVPTPQDTPSYSEVDDWDDMYA